MENILLILGILAGILLVLVILIQNPKGGGIDSSFGAANQLGSVQKTNDVVEKATWYLAVFIVVISLASTAVMSGKNPDKAGEKTESKFDANYNIGRNNSGSNTTTAPNPK